MAADSKSKPKSVSQHDSEPAPPDGGYGWIVLFASFLISFILDGVMYSFGLILTEIKLQFNEPSLGNWLNSLNTGFLFCSGPIVAGLTNQFGCRTVVIGGAIVTSIMYVITALSPNIYLQMLTFGVIGGISTGCTYIASIIVIAHYFDKKRGIATGITMSGSGFGSFAFAPILKWMIDKFDWKFTLVIMACIILECAFLGSLLRPLKGKSSKKASKQLELQNLINEQGMSVDKSDANNSSRPVQAYNGSTLSLDKTKSSGFVSIAIGILKEMTDLSLLVQSKPFLLITLSNFFIFLGYFTPFLYITEVAQRYEIENYAFLLSVIGIVNIPFRMLYGLIADRKIISATNLNTIAALIATVPFFFYHKLYAMFSTQVLFTTAFAIGIAGVNSLTTMYLIEMVGLKKFNQATGIINLFRGFGCFAGTPIAGAIVGTSDDPTKYFRAFLYSGILFSIGFVLAILISFSTTIKKCLNKNKSTKLNQESKDVYVANHINFDNTIHEVDINNSQKFSPEVKNSTGLRALVRCATLSTEAQFATNPEDSDLPLTLQDCSGNDVDVALFKCCESIYPKMTEYRMQNRKVYEMPSNKNAKYQLYIYETDDNDKRYLVVMKGSLEIVLQHCSSIFIEGNDIQLDDQWKNQINTIYQELISTNERVVCFCDIRLDPKQFPVNYSFDPDEIYTFPNLRFLGMVSLVNQQSKIKELA